MIGKEQIDRINELARRVKAGGALTEEETAERDALRRLYLDSVRESLTAQLDRTVVVGPDGTKRKLKKR